MILTLIAYDSAISLGKFYSNRALRIYPLFVFVITLGYFSMPDPRETSVGVDYLLSLLPISNLYRMKYGPFGGQLWSVAVEIQFYLLFPILALKARGLRFYVSLIALLIILRTLIYTLNGTVHQMAYFSIFGNLDAFLIGGITAIAYKETEGYTFRWYWCIAVLVAINVFLVVLYRLIGFPSTSPFWTIWPDVQSLLWSALILSYLRANMRVPLSKLWSYLGKISYSIYAWHILVWMTVAHLMPVPWGSTYLTGLLLVLPATIAIAALSYSVIEAPFLMMRARYVIASSGSAAPVGRP
ncbi:hypothetical protein AXW83_05790 [Bosea sp. PAMC 26642]|nr:hypothetical protein AXW83_05790 [Bosea sp. PAMC 26642]